MRVYRRRITKPGKAPSFSKFWWMEFTAGTGEGSVRVRRSTGALRRKDAESILAQAYSEAVLRSGRGRGQPNPADLITLGSASQMWGRAPSSLSPARKDQAQRVVAQLCTFLGEHRIAADVTSRDLQAWADDLQVSLGNSSGTVINKLGSAGGFWDWMYTRGIVPDEFVTRRVKKPSLAFTPTRPMTPEEVVQVLDWSRGHRVFEPMYLLGFFAGLDRSECCRVQWEHIRWSESGAASQLLVVGTKTRGRAKVVPLEQRVQLAVGFLRIHEILPDRALWWAACMGYSNRDMATNKPRNEIRGQANIAAHLGISVDALRAAAAQGTPLARVIRIEPGGRRGRWVAWDSDLDAHRREALPTLDSVLSRSPQK